ncbi:MAG TPA: alpha/beta hydrolase [Pseudoneobacillus sp.]|nr:alpha/beta hydrolase [Pseudoneobacillus sp.]
MKIISDDTKSTKRYIPFKLYKHEENSNSLTIILPGAGYTTQAPLLHYTTGMMFNKGSDVLLVNYHYSKEVLSSLSEDEITSDVQAVIETILKDNDYTDFTIVAKSIGTIALTYLLKDPNYHSSKAIWLTPLLQRNDVYHALLNNKNKALCIIGDKDPCYIYEKFEEIKKNNQLKTSLIEGVNHSLEFERDIFRSIEVLKDVMIKINQF